MRLDNLILNNNKIYEIVSKTESLNYCVFIQGGCMINNTPSRVETVINKYNIKCNLLEWYGNDIIMEIYDDKYKALERCRAIYDNGYGLGVVLYKNGKKIDID